jgi:hypothetical protein
MKLTYDELLALSSHRQITSRAQLSAYLDNDALECLICGKCFINLGAHIKPAHNVTVIEYKRAFGIPRRYGVIGRAMKAHLQDLAHSPHRIEEARALGQIYGHDNGGLHLTKPPLYSQQTRGNSKPKVLPTIKPEVIQQTYVATRKTFNEWAEEQAKLKGQTEPPVDSMKTYDEHSAQHRLAKLEGLMLVFYTALKEYFRETT